VPQREPLSPPLLAVAGVLAAVPGAWLALALEAVASAAAGALAGFGWGGLALSPSFTVRAVLANGGDHAPALWAIALLAGPIAGAVLVLLLQMAVEAVRAPAWLRVLALEALAFSWLRLPALLVAGAARRGAGPVEELYARLGEPQAGRWSVALLALLVLGAAAAVVGRRAIAVGKGWMRVDGREFRRRLVRVLAGYPSLVALAGWSILAPWAPAFWMLAWLLLTLSALHVLMS
jgi:hypothetical protein